MDKAYSMSVRAFDFFQKHFPEGASFETWIKVNHDHARCALESEFDAAAESVARRCAEIVAAVYGCGVAYHRILREFGMWLEPTPESDDTEPEVNPCDCIDTDAWVCFRGQNIVGMDECPCACHSPNTHSPHFTITFTQKSERELKEIADAVHKLAARFSAVECRVTLESGETERKEDFRFEEIVDEIENILFSSENVDNSWIMKRIEGLFGPEGAVTITRRGRRLSTPESDSTASTTHENPKSE